MKKTPASRKGNNSAGVKRLKFAQGVFAGKTQRQAARDAGYRGSDASVDSQASQLMATAEVQGEIARLGAAGDRKAVAAREEVLALLTDLMRADLTDFVTTKEVVAFPDLKSGPGSPVEPFKSTGIDLAKAQEAKKLGLLASVKIAADGAITIKMPDRLGAIDRLAKLQGWFAPDKLEHSFRPVEQMSRAELEAELAGSLKKLKAPQ